MAVITISRQVGSLGDEIGKAVADKLGYEYIEKTKISEVLSDQGFSASDVDKYDEKKPSIWQSISIQKKKFSHIVRAAIYEIAARDNVVIVGRGGQAILGDLPGTIHVRIIASYATRVGRLMKQKGFDEDEAEEFIRQKDQDSSGYINAYFDADWDDSDLYDIVINTRIMTLDTGVEIISCAVASNEFTQSPEVVKKYGDLALLQKVEAAVMEIPGLEISNIEAERGEVTLSGLAKSIAAKEECEKAISSVEGIAKVTNLLEVAEKKRPKIL